MAASPNRISFDACSWISLIQKEQIRNFDGKIIEDRYALARSVIDRAEKGAVEIVTSCLCLVEVNKESPTTTRDQFIAYFENDYILLVPVDKIIGERARALMFDRRPGIKPPDAIHPATALIANVDEFYTFDTRLLGLDGELLKRDGTPLKICKPGMGGDPLPLFEALNLSVADQIPWPEKDFFETLVLEGLAADDEASAKRGSGVTTGAPSNQGAADQRLAS